MPGARGVLDGEDPNKGGAGKLDDFDPNETLVLEGEEAARLRDEIRRLQATELAVADDPLARQSDIEASLASGRDAATGEGQRLLKGQKAPLPRGRSTAGKAGTRPPRRARKRKGP